ncbi:MAG: ribulose-bisphosphate carboxylase large subunit family protein [Alphaproteobacteria bacterium]|nr:ribulose-bisphosphate carboxylase large subunit family protein [Alphaproteobacteria bacterium]
MSSTRRDFRAVYLIETPLDPAKVAAVLAGEQSSGTFVKVEGESDDLKARAGATVVALRELDAVATPGLPSAYLDRRGVDGPYRRAVIEVDFPVDNIGDNLGTLAATVAGNLFDLGELTGVRLLSLALPPEFARRFDLPRHGVAGTRRLLGIPRDPVLGTIIKPNIGLAPADTGALVARLLDAGLDFIKDDEVMANPAHAPLAERVRHVMAKVDAAADRTGRRAMVAFNITDETDAMRRNADLVAAAGGTCVMASLNWCGLSAIQTLRRSTELAIHGHRNGFAALSRHPALGLDFAAYQALWRLAGVDQLHVNGLASKFAEADDSVVAAARDCLAPIAGNDAIMPVFSSGQWAGTVPATWARVGSGDLMFLAGGGILGHPDGARAGVESIREAWRAVMSGSTLAAQARSSPPLARALDFFGKA